MLKPYGPISVTFWLTADWQHAAAVDFLSNGADFFQICNDLDMINVPSRSKIATRTKINDHFHKDHSLSLTILTFKGEIWAVLAVKVCGFWSGTACFGDLIWRELIGWERPFMKMCTISYTMAPALYLNIWPVWGSGWQRQSYSGLYCNSLSNMSKKCKSSVLI